MKGLQPEFSFKDAFCCFSRSPWAPCCPCQAERRRKKERGKARGRERRKDDNEETKERQGERERNFASPRDEEVAPGLYIRSKKLGNQVSAARGSDAPLFSLCFLFEAPLIYPCSSLEAAKGHEGVFERDPDMFSSSNVLESH